MTKPKFAVLLLHPLVCIETCFKLCRPLSVYLNKPVQAYKPGSFHWAWVAKFSYQRVSKLVMLLENKLTMHRILTMHTIEFHRTQCIDQNAWSMMHRILLSAIHRILCIKRNRMQ